MGRATCAAANLSAEAELSVLLRGWQLLIATIVASLLAWDSKEGAGKGDCDRAWSFAWLALHVLSDSLDVIMNLSWGEKWKRTLDWLYCTEVCTFLQVRIIPTIPHGTLVTNPAGSQSETRLFAIARAR